MVTRAARLVIRQAAIFLIALALVLPRVCIASAEIAPASLQTTLHTHCAEHAEVMPGAHGEDHSGDHGGGGHHCCDQCQCCAAPATAIPVNAPLKLRFAPVATAFAVKAVPRRAELAWAMLPINSHGPPLFS